MRLDEWRTWWKRSGKRGLRRPLLKNWDVVGDNPALATDEFLLSLARRLREDATASEIRGILSDFRQEVQGDRFGRKWATRDRRLAEKVFVWCVEPTR
jgi:hypothetical protein